MGNMSMEYSLGKSGFLISLQNSEEAKPRDALSLRYPKRKLCIRDLNKRNL